MFVEERRKKKWRYVRVWRKPQYDCSGVNREQAPLGSHSQEQDSRSGWTNPLRTETAVAFICLEHGRDPGPINASWYCNKDPLQNSWLWVFERKYQSEQSVMK